MKSIDSEARVHSSGCCSNPTISIIVPVYNTGRYLPECLDSLLGQSFLDIEVICVDDGSTDESPSLLDSYACRDGRVRVFHRENGGVSSARNFGISQSRGRYVLFVDSDDYIEKTTCQLLIEAAKSDDSDIIVFGGVTFPHVDWIDRCFGTQDVTIRGDGIDALLREPGSFPLMCNKMYRRSLIVDNNVSFSSDLVLGEDNAFQFSVFPYAKTVTFLSCSLYHYRCGRSGSAIAEYYGDRLSKIKKHLDVVRYVFNDWQTKGILQTYKKEILGWSLMFLHEDAVKLDYWERREIGKQYGELCDAFAVSSAISELDSFEQKVAAFLSFEFRKNQLPSVSIISFTGKGRTAEEAFLSLSSQDYQNVELLVVCDAGSFEGSAIKASFDPRARVFGSFADAVASARGLYVLVAPGGVVYDWAFVGRMLSAAQGEGADVVVCFDYGNRLRLASEDFNRMLKTRDKGKYPTIECPPDKRLTVFSPTDIPEYAISVLSPSFANKLIRTEHLKRCCSSLQHAHGSFDVLVEAAKIAIVPYRFITMHALPLSKAEVLALADARVQLISEFASKIINTSGYERFAESWAVSSANYLLSGYELVSTYEGKCLYAQCVHNSLGNDVAGMITSSTSLSEDVRNRIASMVSSDAESFVKDDLCGALERFGESAAAHEDAALFHETEAFEFYHSISYRLGRLFTAPLRKCLTLASRTKRVERNR